MYNNPKKNSEVPQQVQDMFGNQSFPKDMSDKLRNENLNLQNEIFDLQDQLLTMEKEYEDIKEEEI